MVFLIFGVIAGPLVLVGVAFTAQFRWTRGPYLLRRWGVRGTAETVDIEYLRGAVMKGTGEHNMQPTRQRARVKLRVSLPDVEPYEVTTKLFVPVMAPTERLTVYASKRNREKVYIAWDEPAPNDVGGGEYGMKGPGRS